MKQCIACKEQKPLGCFSLEGGKYRGSCKSCRTEYRKSRQHIYNERNRQKRILDPERYKAYKSAYREKPGVKEAEAAYRKEARKLTKDRDRIVKRAWVESNRDRIRDQASKKYQENKDVADKLNREWRLANAEYRREYTRKYREEHKGERAACQKMRQARKLQATPSWAQVEEIKNLYIVAASIPGMHVDHIVPLKSKIVCGLHVLANLQIITKEENMAKGNSFWPDMP